MVNEVQLSNAPIKEAVIDIQIASDQIRIDQLESLIKQMPSEYTEIMPISESYMELGISSKGKSAFNNQGFDIVGYRAENLDSNFIAQFKKTGFSLSKLPPYDEWQSFKYEAQKLWPLYRRIVPDLKFSRLAVRYINEMALPIVDEYNKPINFDDYLVNGPKPPIGMGPVVEGFFSKVDIPWPKRNTNIIVMQVLKEITATHAIVVLDTDIYRTSVSDFSEAEMWDFFDDLRDLKNMAFRGSLTDKTMELFK
ncbi:MAG: TIGR04255 family protein [Nitrosomonas sp.]|uniref:TIGR04255 family protein n=1 Tax=Nitrosomonas sp. TaxID=42353 RepID=UPI0027345081|nr:TIGR04255 family protein [Nitrosomonas sp.]MDP3280932.1 TIGR04255 family protein [Nitrosomonas sp.]